MNLTGVAENAFGSLKNQRLRSLYQTDFVAWRADVLGFRSYDKMNEICETALFGDKQRTAIKSSNGTSKTHEVANMVTWTGSVFEPGESLAIVTAPSLPQVEKGIFRYMKTARIRARDRGHQLPGWINESLEWKFEGPEGNVPIAYGRKPAAGSEVSTFQGIRSETGRTFVFADEAGGLSTAMYTAVEAVITGRDSKFIPIGNPDDTGTYWHKIFTSAELMAEYNLFTLSSFDLPTYTNELVYFDAPEMQTQMMKSLTQKSWVEHKQRIWGEKDARYQAKVLGEFPEDAGNMFFGTKAINTAFDTEVEENADVPVILGADIARYGQDESVIYENRGGRLRLLDSWGKTDTVETSRKIHGHASRIGASEVRVDASGIGGAVFDMMDTLDEFDHKVYELIAIDGGSSSPDRSQWANNRAYNHDSLRTQMMNGEIDMDPDDRELRDQLDAVSFKFNSRGAVQITPKDDMKSDMGGSPDRLDAAIYATVDMEWLTGNPINKLAPGEVVFQHPTEVLGITFGYGSPGTPL